MATFSAKLFVLGGGGGSGSRIYYYPSAGAGSIPYYNSSYTLIEGKTYAVVVGAGGIEGKWDGSNDGGSGGTSSFDVSIISVGGGGGKGNMALGGSNSSYNGSTGSGSATGGAGAGAGGDASGINGGIGVHNSISGSDIGYGGGGSTRNAVAAGTAVDGGGWCGTGIPPGIRPAENRGGGEGDVFGEGQANGGSGVIIISYTTPSLDNGIGGTITHNGGNTIHTFTETGSSTFTAPGNLFDALLIAGN